MRGTGAAPKRRRRACAQWSGGTAQNARSRAHQAWPAQRRTGSWAARRTPAHCRGAARCDDTCPSSPLHHATHEASDGQMQRTLIALGAARGAQKRCALVHWAPAAFPSSTGTEAGLQAEDCWRGLATEHRLAHDIAVAVQSCLEDDWRSSAGLQLDQGTAQLWSFQRAYAGATSLLADGSLLIGGLLQVIDQTTARGRAPVPAAA